MFYGGGIYIMVMDFIKRIVVVLVLSMGLSLCGNAKIQAVSNEIFDKYLKELIGTQSFTNRAFWNIEKDIVKFGGTALLLTFCKKLGDPKFGQKLGLKYDKHSDAIMDPIVVMFLVGILASLWPTISEMFFVEKDQSYAALKNLNRYISNLDSNQKTQFEDIKRSMQKEFSVTTLIDIVILPLLFYFCFFKSDNDDYNKTFAIVYGLISAIGAAAPRHISLQRGLNAR
jgi:hypothetical protein